MNLFATRRWFGTLLLLAAVAGLLALWLRFDPLMPKMPYLTGWFLFVLMVVLAAYNGRKKLPFLPAVRSDTWLQVHIYVGFFTAALFAVHVGMRIPGGWFESVLAWLYVLVMVSGIGGLAMSRIIPKRLTTRGGEVLYEQIPAVRRALADEAESLALKAVAEAKNTTIMDFYTQHLQAFFAGPRNVMGHIFEVTSPLNELQHRINEMNRFLNAKERVLMDRVAELVRQKDGLDYHYSLQLALRLWLFVHIPLTYSLLIFSVVHVVLVFAFSGGTP